jgi:DNA-directed RNA polymerase specialized sigma subunit
MEKLKGLELLKATKYISKEIQVIERAIQEQTAAMQGLSSMRISDMPRSKKMPEGMERVYANKDELEREQRETVAELYTMLRDAEELLQKEKNADMRLILRVMYVENKPAREARRLLHLSKSTIDRIHRKIKEKYTEGEGSPS